MGLDVGWEAPGLKTGRGLPLQPVDFLARLTTSASIFSYVATSSAESRPSVPRLVSRNALAVSHALARFSRRVKI
jgi:hypothetical protein